MDFDKNMYLCTAIRTFCLLNMRGVYHESGASRSLLQLIIDSADEDGIFPLLQQQVLHRQ